MIYYSKSSYLYLYGTGKPGFVKNLQLVHQYPCSMAQN